MTVSDCYSRFLEIMRLPTTTSAQVIQNLKTVFARFGIPDKVVSSNGPQFVSAEFREFAKSLDFKHCTSSPHHPHGTAMPCRMGRANCLKDIEATGPCDGHTGLKIHSLLHHRL
uniref:Integrase catalytic domain-containing protein n=1 Tax=Nothobranchius furzeri TaxID=105023 RepID=A0A1A8AQL2_NOTFU